MRRVQILQIKEIYAQKVFIFFVVASYTCIQQVFNPLPHPPTHYIGVEVPVEPKLIEVLYIGNNVTKFPYAERFLMLQNYTEQKFVIDLITCCISEETHKG